MKMRCRAICQAEFPSLPQGNHPSDASKEEEWSSKKDVSTSTRLCTCCVRIVHMCEGDDY